MDDYLPIMQRGIVSQTEAPTRYARLPTHSAPWNDLANDGAKHLFRSVTESATPRHNIRFFLHTKSAIPHLQCGGNLGMESSATHSFIHSFIYSFIHS
jgi:hypothetical protein